MTTVPHIALVLGAALLSLTACQATGQSGTTEQSAGQARASSAFSSADATFINKAGTSGLEEVAFAQLAETKATDPAVRHFAEKIIADLTPINQQLAALTESHGLTPPSSMDEQHQTLFQELQSLKGAAFDHAYRDGQLQDLTMATEAYQNEADSGSDPRVRSFAQQYQPMMLEDIRMADTIAGL